ncbi:DNA double-strand break repair Rad50 ATPase, partial [Reticulomyxa filosa]
KTTYVKIEKLKKDIESKDNEINKIKQEIQFKQKQIIQQIDENKKDQTQNIINISSTLDFQLVRSFKLNNTFTGHTNTAWSIDYSTFDDCQFICSGSYDKTVRVWD